MQTIHHAVPPPRHPASHPVQWLAVPTVKHGAHPGRVTAVAWPAVPRAQAPGDDRWRTVLATAVVCTGLFVAGTALWQASNARTVYIPISVEAAAPMVAAPSTPAPYRSAVVTVSAPVPQREPVALEGVVSGNPMGMRTVASVPPVSRAAIPAPAMPLTWTPPSAVATPPPVDYAARDRQIADLKRRTEDIDETIRRVRADPHWYGLVKGSTDTSRQQASDAYLNDLDRQRNDLRRQKWALEGR